MEEAAPGAMIDDIRARAVADSFVETRGWRSTDLELVEAQSATRANRTDHDFAWNKRGSQVAWRGSDSDADFARFISFARKSTFECASMLIMFQRDNLLAADRTDDLLDELEQLSRMQTAFKKTLRSK